MANVADTYMIYQVLKRLTTPFDETKAFELGLIDKNGKLLKKAKTSDEKNAYTYFDRFIFNLKRLLHRVGLKSKFASYGAALFLLKEDRNGYMPTDQEMLKGVLEEELYLRQNYAKNFSMLREDAPANATGAAVAGTGDDKVHWRSRGVKSGIRGRKQKVGRSISALNFIKQRRKLMANTNVKSSYPAGSFKLESAHHKSPDEEKVDFKQADTVLPTGEKHVLQARDPKRRRGLVVVSNKDGSYDINYWWKDAKKVAPIEVVIDGKEVSGDAKIIKLKYHPEDYYEEQANPRIPRKPGQPAGSDKHSDLYTDENPKGTIKGLKFATVQDAKDSVSKIKNSGASHAHKIQAAVAMEQRAIVAKKRGAAAIYRIFINKMKKKTKEMQKESLYANIHKKRQEGRPMRKKGAKGAPKPGDFDRAARTAKEEAPVIGGIKMKKLGKGPKGSYKSLVTRHLGAKAAEKIDKSDGSKLVAKGKKTGNKELVRKGNFIRNIIGRK